MLGHIASFSHPVLRPLIDEISLRCVFVLFWFVVAANTVNNKCSQITEHGLELPLILCSILLGIGFVVQAVASVRKHRRDIMDFYHLTRGLAKAQLQEGIQAMA